MELNAGANQILLDADAEDLLEAGFTNGPFTIEAVTLRREVFGRDTVVDYHATMGTTPAYQLGDFERGSIYFSGQAAELALDTDGVSGYDVLRVQAELIQGSGVSSESMACKFKADLTDGTGFVIDSVNADATSDEGANTLTLDFRGPKIARSNINGPYQVRSANVTCSGMQDNAALLLTTGSYLARNLVTRYSFHSSRFETSPDWEPNAARISKDQFRLLLHTRRCHHTVTKEICTAQTCALSTASAGTRAGWRLSRVRICLLDPYNRACQRKASRDCVASATSIAHRTDGEDTRSGALSFAS